MPIYDFPEDFISAQRPEHQQMILAIDRLIRQSDGRFRSFISFRTIFYKIKKEIIYIGKIRPKTGIEVCFMRGLQMPNTYGLLDDKGRKIISGITFLNLKQIEEQEDQFMEYVQEAILLDEKHDKSAFYEVLSGKRKGRSSKQ